MIGNEELQAIGLSTFECIQDAMHRYDVAESNENDDVIEDIREEIYGMPLSLEYMREWTPADQYLPSLKPSHYRLLLSTGGPAAAIVGAVNEDGEHVAPTLQVQHWGTPWRETELTEGQVQTLQQFISLSIPDYEF